VSNEHIPPNLSREQTAALFRLLENEKSIQELIDKGKFKQWQIDGYFRVLKVLSPLTIIGGFLVWIAKAAILEWLNQ